MPIAVLSGEKGGAIVVSASKPGRRACVILKIMPDVALTVWLCLTCALLVWAIVPPLLRRGNVPQLRKHVEIKPSPSARS